MKGERERALKGGPIRYEADDMAIRMTEMVDEGLPTTAATFGNGRYAVRGQLGQGGASTVYLVEDTLLGVTRALKLLRGASPVLRHRFHAEARALARIHHPHVVRLLDYGEDLGNAWIVLEVAPGGSLTRRLGAGALAPAEALRVIFEALAGLSAVHNLGLIHRDVKPGNLLFGPSSEVWLSDLGVVGRSELVGPKGWQTTGDLGTTGYRSPELRRAPQDVDQRSDLYAMGATLYAAITARTPPDLWLLDLKPEILNRVTERIRPIIRRATRTNPNERYLNAHDMAQDIANALATLEGGGETSAKSLMTWFTQCEQAAAAATLPPMSSAPVSLTLADQRAPTRTRPWVRWVGGGLTVITALAALGWAAGWI